jgi:hypothetical protein
MHYDYADYYEERRFDEQELKDLRSAKEWVEELVLHMYETGDVPTMENALQELCAVYDVKLPSKVPAVAAVFKGKQVSGSIDLFDLGVHMMKAQGGGTMSCLENEKLYEERAEAFFCALIDDVLMSEIIDEEATHEEIWASKQIDDGTEFNEAVGRFFDRIWEWDMEIACGDPIQATLTYLKYLKNNK